MIVGNALISDGKSIVSVLKDPISVSVNSIAGQRSDSSFVQLTVPTDGTSHGSIQTIGNAAVKGKIAAKIIGIKGGKKQIRAENFKGFFAKVFLGFHRDSQLHCFELIFGKHGLSETKDDSGSKDRPHLAFYPDGNGSFIRLEGYDCTIESAMTYSAATGEIQPKTARIIFHEENLALVLRFLEDHEEKIVLESIAFEDHHLV